MGDAFSDCSYCELCGRKIGPYAFCGKTCEDVYHLRTGTFSAENRPEGGNPNSWALVQRWTSERFGKKNDHERVVRRYISEEVTKLAIREIRA